MNEPGPGRGGAGRGLARAALNLRFAELLSRCPACSERSLSLDSGISLASSKEEWKRFGCFPGRGGKISAFGQAQESPDSSGEALASPFFPGLWNPLLPPEAAVGRTLFSAINKDSCL